MRVAINGFGRIGRSVFRILNDRENVDVVAINDIADNEAMAYLLKYDTVMGRFNDSVTVDNDIMKTSFNKVKMLAEREPGSLPWNDLDVDVVIESTGIFRTRTQLEDHLNSGSKRVILTVPSKDFVSSIERVASVSLDRKEGVKLKINRDNVQLSVNSANSGDGNEKIEAK